MEQMTMNSARRAQAHRAYGRPADAFDSVAWRPPTPTRFDGRPANDLPATGAHEARSGLPSWVTVVGGGVAAALMGAILGGTLHI